MKRLKKREPNVLEALALYSRKRLTCPFEKLMQICCEEGAVTELQFLRALKMIGRLPAHQRKRLEKLMAENEKE